MAETTPPCPRGHLGTTIAKDGWSTGPQGRRQRYRCIDADGVAHRFLADATETASKDARRTGLGGITCPEPGHGDATLRSRGLRQAKTGTWRRVECIRPNGEKHTFSALVLAPGEEATLPSRVPPPACSEHPGSRVVRNGTYGRRSSRQRYLCRPEDGEPHQFTPPLSRQVVLPGTECKKCDELLSPHHGPLTAARATTWPLPAVVEALNALSLGESYANTALAMRARRDQARDHLRHAHGIVAFASNTTSPVIAASTQDHNDASPVTETTSASRKERRNAWRAAADIVEQYSPPLFAALDARYRHEAVQRRAANDDALAQRPDARLDAPLVYILDELPVWGQPAKGQPKRPQWYVLTVVEVLWRPNPDPHAPPQRDSRLRLARAFPRANSDAWRLVLNELAVRPDFVVADYGSGLQRALRLNYDDQVGVVPSLWHLHRNLRDALVELDNTYFLDNDERVLVDPLRKHLSQLGRDELLGKTAIDIADWFDELEAIVRGLPAPVSSVQNLRALHEPRLAAALPILTANPHVPASNAVVENRIRNALKPFLSNRAHMFGNAERTNRLLNLLVCRQGGVFTNLDELTAWLRNLNEANGGWAPEPRTIVDTQPAALAGRNRRFESLKSHSVIVKLAKDQGVATTAEIAAAQPLPVLHQQRPETIAALPIREWARSVNLPGAPTGPIKPAVRHAYELFRNGATVEDALAAYDAFERERLDKQQQARSQKWTAKHARTRRQELAPIKAWALENGYTLPGNNSVPAHIRQAYDDAQRGVTRTRPSKQPQNTPTKKPKKPRARRSFEGEEP